MTGTTKYKMVCAYCGSEDVLKDAYSKWSVDEQDWVLHQTFDDAICNTCGGETTTLNEEPIISG